MSRSRSMRRRRSKEAEAQAVACIKNGWDCFELWTPRTALSPHGAKKNSNRRPGAEAGGLAEGEEEQLPTDARARCFARKAKPRRAVAFVRNSGRSNGKMEMQRQRQRCRQR